MLTEIAVTSDYGERTHTPSVVDAVLPLPELMPREEPSPSDSMYRGGGVVVAAEHTILWRTNNRELTLELANLNGPEKGSHVLSFVAPGPILAYATTITALDDTTMVVDFFLKSGFLYTLSLPFRSFNHWSPETNWRTVKCPFGVDVVTIMGLVARGPLELVATLADGTVTRLLRSNVLAELEIHTLQDPQEPTFFQRLLGKSNDEVEGYEGLSVRAGIDVSSFDDKVVVLCVDGNIRVWSTATNNLVEHIKSDNPSNYTSTPSKYFKISGDHLCVFTNEEFRTYNTAFELQEVYPIPEQLSSWYMVDYVFTEGKVVAAFRAAQNSQIWCIEPTNSYSISTQKPSISRVPDQREMQRFIDNIFSVKTYSSMTLRKALAAYTNSAEVDVANLTVSAPPSSALSLRDAVTESIQKQSSKDKSDYRLQWIRFDSLCEEFESQLNEVRGLGYGNDGLLWSVRAAYYTLLCPTSSIQRALNLDLGSKNSISSTINELYHVFPPSVIVAYEQDLRKTITSYATWGSELLSARMIQTHESFIAPHVDERDVVAIRNSLVEVESLDEKIKGILEACLIKDVSEDAGDNTLTPLGCSALSTIALDHAESSIKFVSKVLFFMLFAFGEGRTKSHFQLYATGLAHMRTSWAIISLQDPLDSFSTRYNRQTSALEVAVSRLNIKVRDFDLLVSRLWYKLDYSDVRNLKLMLFLLKEHWSPAAALNAIQYLGDDAESNFIKGLVKISIKEQQDTGENIIRALAPQLSTNSPNLGITGFGEGISHYFLAVTELSREIDISTQCTLNFAKLAARYGDGNAQIYRILLDLALLENDHVRAYEAICGLRQCNDPDIKRHLEKFLDATVNRRTMEYVCKELVFPGLVELVPEILEKRSVLGGLPAYKLLYVWNISRRNYLAAAKAVYNHIHGEGKRDGNFLDLYTITLNALKLVEKNDRWFVLNKKIVTEQDIENECQNIYVKT